MKKSYEIYQEGQLVNIIILTGVTSFIPSIEYITYGMDYII